MADYGPEWTEHYSVFTELYCFECGKAITDPLKLDCVEGFNRYISMIRGNRIFFHIECLNEFSKRLRQRIKRT